MIRKLKLLTPIFNQFKTYTQKMYLTKRVLAVFDKRFRKISVNVLEYYPKVTGISMN